MHKFMGTCEKLANSYELTILSQPEYALFLVFKSDAISFIETILVKFLQVLWFLSVNFFGKPDFFGGEFYFYCMICKELPESKIKVYLVRSCKILALILCLTLKEREQNLYSESFRRSLAQTSTLNYNQR